MSDYLAEVLRSIRSELEDVKRRVASVVMIGQVKQVSGDKLRLEFDEKDPSTGKPFQSPLVRRANSAGVNGTGHKERNRPVVGETMALISPNGEIGPHSRAIPYGPTDESAEPSAEEGFARVWSEGEASISMSGSEIRLRVGNATVSVKNGEIRSTVGGTEMLHTPAGLDQTGGHHKHNGKNTGHDHIHGGIVPGGSDTDVPSN
jgi:hypothetical protein